MAKKKKEDLGTYGGRKIIAMCGHGYKKTFTEKEGLEIERLRKEMRERLYAPG